MNKVMLIGNVGKDPDIHYFEADQAVAQVSLAIEAPDILTAWAPYRLAQSCFLSWACKGSREVCA